MPDPIKPVEPNKLPVLAVIKESCILPLKHFRALLASAGIAVAGVLFLFAVLIALRFAAAGVETIASSGVEDVGDFLQDNPGWLVALVLSLLLSVFLGVISISVGTFNFWVRLAVLQDDKAWRQSIGDWFRQIGTNTLNLIWIGIVVAICVWILIGTFLFLVTMLIKPFAVGLFTEDVMMFFGSAFLMGVVVVAFSILAAYVACFIYARFSLSLVEGALGDFLISIPPRDLIRRHSARFALVLCAVYVVGMVVKAILSILSEVPVVGDIINLFQLPAIFYAIAVIGAAHGIVFRLNFEVALGASQAADRTGEIPTLEIFSSGVSPGDEEAAPSKE